MNAHEWSSRIANLARRESGALADLLLALAEFDRLAVYRLLGFASLFDFLHREMASPADPPTTGRSRPGSSRSSRRWWSRFETDGSASRASSNSRR